MIALKVVEIGQGHHVRALRNHLTATVLDLVMVITADHHVENILGLRVERDQGPLDHVVAVHHRH